MGFELVGGGQGCGAHAFLVRHGARVQPDATRATPLCRAQLNTSPPLLAPFVAYRMRCIDHACRIAGKPTIAIRCATCLVSLQRDAIATCGRRSMRLDADAARIAFWARRQILSFRARVRRHQAAGIPEHKSFGPSCLSGGSSVMWRTTLQVFGRSSPSKMLQVYALRLVCEDIA